MKNLGKAILFHQGAEEYGSDKIFYLVCRLLKSKHELTVVLDSDGPLVKKIKALGVENIIIMDLAVLRRDKISLSKLFSFTCDFFKAVTRVRKLIKKTNPQLLYVNTLAVVSPLFACILIKNSKVIHHLHEIQTKPKYLFRLLYSISGALSDKVLCVSESVVKCYKDMTLIGKDKSSLLYNGLPEQKPLDPKIKESLSKEISLAFGKTPDFLLAYVARLHTWKGQSLFLDVIQKLKDEYELDVKVAFFGDCFSGYEYLLPELKNKAQRLGIENNVHFFGFRKDAQALFELSNISIMGSIDPDPLPTIVLESFQCKTPVFAYAHGGSTEMVVDNETGHLIDPLETDKMAKKIAEYYRRNYELEQMGLNAFIRYKDKFSIEAFEKNLHTELEF